jgi:hypothetical protein
MNALQSRLAALRRRLRLVTLARGLSLLVLVLLGGVIAAGLLDWTADLPGLVRAVLLVLILSGSSFIVWRYLLAPLAAQADDLALALRIEEAYPTLNDALASTVQFLQQPESASAGSPVLRREAVQRALRLAEGCDFTKVVNRRGLRLTELAAVAILGLGVILLWRQPALSATALLRLANPYGEHDWPKATQLDLDFRERIAIGQPFILKGAVSGVVPSKAVIEFEGLSSSREVKEYPIQKGDKEAASGTFQAKLDMTRQQHAFRFRVRANDATFPKRPGAWQTIRVAQPPQLAALEGSPSPQWELRYPAYTDLPSPVKLPPGVGLVEAIAGTDVVLRAATDRPIASASLRLVPTEEIVLPGLAVAPIGSRLPLEALANVAGGSAVLDRVPAKLAPDGRRFHIAFRPFVSGLGILRLEDDEGLAKEYEYQFRVNPDPLPIVSLVRPSSSQSVLADAEITLQVLAEDEIFALRSVYLEYHRKDKEGRPLEEPGRLSLYDRHALGAALPQLASALAMQLVPVPGPAWRLRPKRLEISRRWPLTGLVQEGDILVIQACAEDFNDVVAHRVPGRSAEIELRIVGRHALAAILDEKQSKIQQELLRLREWQEKALKKVIEAQQQHKATGKLRPEDHEGLIEAEQLQKQIQARIGETPEQGLRGELKKLEQTVKDNKLPPSGVRDRLQVMKNELERLAREHLPQIEPQITSARQELAEEAQAADQAGKNKTGPKDKAGPAPKQRKGSKAEAELSKARTHQQEVQQSLEELLKYLEHWAGLNEIRAETRAALQEQKDLKNEVEKVKPNLDRAAKEQQPADEQSKAALARIAELQRRLADRVERLLDKMDRVSQEKAAKDPPAAEMLDKAAKIGRENELVKEMRDTADRQVVPKDDKTDKPLTPNLDLGIQQQGESIKTLQRMVEALQEQHQDELERLVKKQKQERKNLDELQERLEKLEKKVQEAKKIADPQQRQAELKRLAQEQRQLQEEARKKGRELARLQAPRAGKEMEQAAEQMGWAAKQLDDGDDPDEAQQQAKERLKKAQEELKLAEKQAQDELAREQLLRLADQIKGLKERQDQAVKESERIHKRVLQEGWGRGLLVSLEEHRQVQQGLSKEAASLTEKLKGAPVFEMLMKKAGREMEAAAKSMKEREDKAIPRQGNPLDKQALVEENYSEEKTEKFQKAASHRLERLLTALKPMLDQARRQEDEDKQGGQGGGGQKGGIRGGDNIPPLAQLKALRDEQLEVKERTEAFAKAHPDIQKLNPEQRAELQSLHADQEELFRLFRQLMTAANQEEKQ